MIPRYTRPEMASIWEPENKFKIWLEIETLACEKMAELGIIPTNVPQVLRDQGGFDIDRIDEIEREVKHDVIAFLTSVAEHIGPDSRYVHQGMTSSDVVDTAFAVQLTQSADLLIKDMEALLKALKKRAFEHKDTICVGRSHGIHAEPTTFGLKLATHYAAFNRGLQRLREAREEIAVCTISGAVGTFATVDPSVEEYVAAKMGLNPETIATQIIPRDRHAAFFAALAIIASSIENIAIEIRHLQRTEVREAEEYFSAGQKGSSAMPHKRNPILSENLTGLARLVRSAVVPALENVALWHERDISHSSVERNIGPDACVTLDFALSRLTGLIENLLVYPDTMKANLEKLGGLVFSQRVLLALTQVGITREESYRIVQTNAMKVWESGGKESFLDLLLADPSVTDYVSKEKLEDIFDYEHYIKHRDKIFGRVFGEI
ncbi:MAG: adenylosuccinate lyase [Rhodospirillales bacterium]|nr:adenylosuccinate lyase [Rhodospirillales bacterium]MCB9995144.1 adenylosuccinate lyase [Rhodospirillales bacterium]